MQRAKKLSFPLILLLLLAACQPGESQSSGVAEPETADSTANTAPAAANQSEAEIAAKYEDLQIVTLLPRDAIPAIDDPRFLSASEADEFYDQEELVMGVVFDGDARAYSVPFLSGHEIVNDTVGGRQIAVTW